MAEEGATARFLLKGLPDGLTEESIGEYFGQAGMLEEVRIRESASGKRSGSIKFAAPTMDIRRWMLEELHMIGDVQVTPMTWKMEKQQRPNYFEKLKAERAAKGGAAITPGRQPLRSASGLGSGFGGVQQAWAAKGAAFGGVQPPALNAWKGSIMPRSKGGAMLAPKTAAPKGAAPIGLGGGSGAALGWGSGNPGFKGKGKAVIGIPALKMGGQTLDLGKGGLRTWESKLAAMNKGKGATQGVKRTRPDVPEITCRYLLSHVPVGTSEEEVGAYFGSFCEIEDLTLTEDKSGVAMSGSIRFLNPGLAVRSTMLEQQHQINGQPILVQTWKMKKLARKQWSGVQQPAQAEDMSMFGL